MPSKPNTECECGRPASVKTNTGMICTRCNEIDHRMKADHMVGSRSRSAKNRRMIGQSAAVFYGVSEVLVHEVHLPFHSRSVFEA